jgi:hypothetical protein
MTGGLLAITAEYSAAVETEGPTWEAKKFTTFTENKTSKQTQTLLKGLRCLSGKRGERTRITLQVVGVKLGMFSIDFACTLLGR